MLCISEQNLLMGVGSQVLGPTIQGPEMIKWSKHFPHGDRVCKEIYEKVQISEECAIA